MNADELLRFYERVADAPAAVARLRRFVLDLAVRGKLVAQDPADEPAPELLCRIAAKKALADRKVRGRIPRPSPHDGPQSSPGLPAGWAYSSLSELVTVLNGRAYKQSELLGAGTPVLRVGNLFTSDKWYYSNLDLEDDKYCEAGDLIFAWSASFGPFIWAGERVIYHYHIWKLPLHSESDLDKNYLFKVLLQKTRELKEAGHGVSMLHMTKESMERLQIPVPPLAEQHRVVAKVDELMALCDQLEAARATRELARDRLAAASLARLNAPDPETFHEDARFALDALPGLTTRPDQIKPLRQTILALAVRGKLAPQDPKDGSAADLFRHIATQRANLVKSGEIRSQKPLPAISQQELPFDLPVGWAWTRLGTIIDLVSGQHLQPNEYSLDPSAGLPYITGPADFRPDGLDISRFALIRKAVAKRGQLLLTVKGSGVGKTAECDIKEVAISRQLMALSPIGWNQHFLTLVTHRLAEALQGRARSLIPGISREDVDGFVFGLPPLAEQHRVVDKVDELMALCDRLEANLTSTDTHRRRLLEALLHNALQPSDLALAAA